MKLAIRHWASLAIRYGVVALLLLHSGISRANNLSCASILNSGFTIQLPAIVDFPADAPVAVGTPLGPPIYSAQTQVAIGCTDSTPSAVIAEMKSTQPPTGLTTTINGITYPIYQTGISGVGVYFYSKDVHFPAYGLAPTWTTIATNCCGMWSWNLTVGAQFVALGTPIGTGVMPGGLIGQWRVRDTNDGTTTSIVPFNLGPASITASTCTVVTQNVSVIMPVVDESKFSGVGSTVASKPFTISLNCPSGIALAMTLTDASNTSNTSNILSLAPGTYSAAGVGISIAYNGTPVSYGPASPVAGTLNQFFMTGGRTAGGPVNIDFTAAYIQSGSAVTPGPVKGLATFTMSYQ